MGQDVSAIKREGGFLHRTIDRLEIQPLEFVPFGQHGQRMRAVGGSIRIGLAYDRFLELTLCEPGNPRKVAENGTRRDSWIVDREMRLLVQQPATNINGRR